MLMFVKCWKQQVMHKSFLLEERKMISNSSLCFKVWEKERDSILIVLCVLMLANLSQWGTSAVVLRFLQLNSSVFLLWGINQSDYHLFSIILRGCNFVIIHGLHRCIAKSENNTDYTNILQMIGDNERWLHQTNSKKLHRQGGASKSMKMIWSSSVPDQHIF